MKALPDKVILGTRGSPLALWQTEQVLHQLHQVFSEVQFEIRIVKTQGDKILDLPLAQIGDKGLFTKELEQELLAGTIDLAVHSLKDLPTELPAGMCIGAILERGFPQDALVSRHDIPLDVLPQNALIGTGSLRRLTQLKRLRPDLQFKDLRGNIQTRLEKLERGDYDAIVMARAALERMGLGHKITMIFPPSQMLPAVGQGAIAVEISQARSDIMQLLQGIHHQETAALVLAERAFLKALGGGCEKPIAGYAHCLAGEHFVLYGYLADEAGNRFLYERIEGLLTEGEHLGAKLAQQILAMGGAEILRA